MTYPAGTKFINPSTGEVKNVKWANSYHIQFDCGSSVSPKHVKLYYSEADIVLPGEVKPWISGDERTKIVDNR